MYIGLTRYLLKTANRLGGRLQVASGSYACQTYARYNPLVEKTYDLQCCQTSQVKTIQTVVCSTPETFHHLVEGFGCTAKE